MKYYLIAGEASGDLHGSNLIKALQQKDAYADIRCWGGDLMQQTGATLVKHYKHLAFMGFIEVIKNLRTIFKNLSFCKKDILQYKPDVLILIDYPGFNLRIAKWAHQQHIKIIYYISPQVWAWKASRVKNIKKYVDKMLVILPFEKAFYQKYNCLVDYVGHPLVQVIEQFKQQYSFQPLFPNHQPNDNIVALLPGSRKQEIAKKLPIMLAATKAFPQCAFVLAQAPGLEDDFYNNYIKEYPNVYSVKNNTYALLINAKAAIVTSGTATLETALFAVPEVICYKGNAISYAIAKRLVHIKYICLVNLILDREVVKELIQDDVTAENIQKELHALLYNAQCKQQLQQDYDMLKSLLSKGGDASENAADIIWKAVDRLYETGIS